VLREKLWPSLEVQLATAQASTWTGSVKGGGEMELHPRRRTAAWIGGVVACLLLIAAGIAYIVTGVIGRDTVKGNVSRELIAGSPDTSPDAIRAGLKEAGLENVPDIPTCTLAEREVTTGADAKCFADYMRMHAFESSAGLTYAQTGRFALASNPSDPKGTSDEALALKDEKGKPVPNGPRSTWVTETALATGLNMAYFADQVGLFGIVVGIMMIIIGVGLGVLTVFGFGLTPWRAPAASEPAAAPQGNLVFESVPSGDSFGRDGPSGCVVRGGAVIGARPPATLRSDAWMTPPPGRHSSPSTTRRKWSTACAARSTRRAPRWCWEAAIPMPT
jgi:hypothetical protein